MPVIIIMKVETRDFHHYSATPHLMRAEIEKTFFYYYFLSKSMFFTICSQFFYASNIKYKNVSNVIFFAIAFEIAIKTIAEKKKQKWKSILSACKIKLSL